MTGLPASSDARWISNDDGPEQQSVWISKDEAGASRRPYLYALRQRFRRCSRVWAPAAQKPKQARGSTAKQKLVVNRSS